MLAANPATAFWRNNCGHAGSQSTDAIVNPGATSSHEHDFLGGCGYHNRTTYEDLVSNPFTTCTYSPDKSSYWFPSLYCCNGDNCKKMGTGGSTVYYLFPGDDRRCGSPHIPFPPGFRFLAGTPSRRTPDSSPEVEGISYVCVNGQGEVKQLNQITGDCPGGFITRFKMPSCWNGQLDSPDHKSHVTYPIEGGCCPQSHPHRLPSMFFQNWYDGKCAGSGGRYVLSMGDETGLGMHADFIAGWEGDSLARAIAECKDSNDDCDFLRQYKHDESRSCIADAPTTNFPGADWRGLPCIGGQMCGEIVREGDVRQPRLAQGVPYNGGSAPQAPQPVPGSEAAPAAPASSPAPASAAAQLQAAAPETTTTNENTNNNNSENYTQSNGDATA
ncbi:hypothetical protein HK102_006114, partial [Quaeritorhiza haematococci]